MALVVGLTGGIASGKSTVSAYLKEKGAQIVDADAIAHTLALPGAPLYKAYVTHFGRDILLEDGALNREKIGAIVFKQPEEKQWVNAISHPMIQEEAYKQLQVARQKGTQPIIFDVPLLLESGWDCMTDLVCLVFTDEMVQLERLMARNGYSREEALARIRSQMPLQEKKKRAHALIDNNGDLSATLRQVDDLWRKWLHGVSQGN